MIVGFADAGKTSLCHALKRFYQTEQPNEDTPLAKVTTDGVEIHQLSIVEPFTKNQMETPIRKMTVNVWDFAGQEDYYLTHRFFLTSNSLILYVLDMTQENQDHEYWFQSIQSIAPDTKIIVVGTRLGTWMRVVWINFQFLNR
jgi:GTPase SAR1 family protein